MSTASRFGRPSGLALVGYGMTFVGFVQVAVTIAPQVAARIPAAGEAAPAVGVAVALAADVMWASLGHTTIHAYKSGQTRAALGFGVVTALAVAVSTVLLAAVGHMGPWSAIPALAALLLVADGIRDQVTVSPETAATIRARTTEIRDERALAVIEARHEAHMETLAGHRESARLAARTGALADIRVTVQRAENRAAKRLTLSAKRHAAGAGAYRELISGTPDTTPDAGGDIEGDTDHDIAADIEADNQPHEIAAPTLTVIPDMADDDADTEDDTEDRGGLCPICNEALKEENGNQVHNACGAAELRAYGFRVGDVADLYDVDNRTVQRWTNGKPESA